MKIRSPVLLGWLLTSGCATTPPAPTSTAPAPSESARTATSAEPGTQSGAATTAPSTPEPAPSVPPAPGTQPQTEDEKTLYALGLSLGRALGVFSLTAEELEYVRAGLYASVRAETPAVDLPTYGPKIKELAASRQKGQATPERRLRPSAVSGNQPQTEEHKTLYALGLSLGQPLGMFHLTAEDLENVRAGLYASVRAETPAVEIAIYGTKIQMLAVNRSRAQAAVEKEKSKPFLDQAAQERGAVKTGSGLIYKKLRAGKGASPRASDIVRVHYRGTLIDGTEFDSSYKRGEPATFPLDGVIKCWNEGVQRMKTGGKAQLVCPSTLAYGDMGAPPDIKPGATLIFNVELLDVTRKELLEGFQKP